MYVSRFFNPDGTPYFKSTFAPASSSCFLILAASSFDTSALTSFGAPSTRSLASLRPRPVIARTSLITLIFLSPASVRKTVNSVFSAAGAAAAAAGAAGAGGGGEPKTPTCLPEAWRGPRLPGRSGRQIFNQLFDFRHFFQSFR